MQVAEYYTKCANAILSNNLTNCNAFAFELTLIVNAFIVCHFSWFSFGLSFFVFGWLIAPIAQCGVITTCTVWRFYQLDGVNGGQTERF